ncbi:hypothetical protein Glove_194g146 [Diversispora epigaea]|uniref:BZIP domain-containing protein n=1 Tax=Diversispora epigaea TaxID=1348612 RepID=A0A397ISF7_9GLOM|nr:hypothetical protein Glove_194g146 [Diversispora epigaea]
MENTHFLLNELSSLSPNQTFCNESFSFMNELTIQDVESEIENQSNKRNREEYEGGEEDGEGEDAEKIKREKKRESDRKSALRYRKKKKSEAEKLEQKVNELEEKNKLLKNEVNGLCKEFLELRDFVMIHIICNHFPNQTFCNESFSFMNELTIQDVESEIENQSNKRNREEYEGGEEDGEGEDAEKIKREKKRESDRKSALRYRKKKKSEAEKLEQKVNELEEKNKLLKNEVNGLCKEFLELRDFVMIHIICNHL